MDLTISLMNGSSHTLRVCPHDTVDSLKILIQQKLGIACESQKLVFENGCSTTLNRRLCDPRVLRPALRVQGEPAGDHTGHNPGVPQKREGGSRVEERERVPVSQQRLLHESREMNEGKLSDYNVRANSTIFLNLRLRGG
ncbi:hypothetical protein KUCAC02_028465 [Chaenocephalus aceratus]|uniref:Uncharacterized protein n=1 Tax=Chaenocephalus aceratus TaxID=36190 RepID=A0ACB9X331_CHAAC|nr:hypothetical protein KUCAC02_028465 [Chaenocephalus aceratus]